MSKVIRETIVAGATILRTIKVNCSEYGPRKPKANPTSEAVRTNNDRIAERNLTALLNANFFPGDLHITLTYEELLNEEEQKAELNKFLRRMKREFKKADREFRYVHATEYENHRPHHHIVMSYIDLPVIHKQWKQGRIYSSMLDTSRNYATLASYLIKETNKTFREAGNAMKCRYHCSRNLDRPIIVREVMSSIQLFEKPAEIKGYSIDEDSIRYYQHPFTAMEHLEYLMISTDPVPRIKKWRKGKRMKRGESFRRFEEIKQLELDDFGEYEWGTI